MLDLDPNRPSRMHCAATAVKTRRAEARDQGPSDSGNAERHSGPGDLPWAQLGSPVPLHLGQDDRSQTGRERFVRRAG